MSNMSYCRFQNTARDLHDCETSFEEMLNGTDEPLSAEELGAAKRLVASCLNIIQLMSDSGGIDIEIDELDRKINTVIDNLSTNADCNRGEEEPV